MKPITVSLIASLLIAIGLAPRIAPASVPAPDGAAIYKQRCQACHTLEKDARAIAAPNLYGVLGRTAGATGFTYSPALKNSGLVWTRQNLDAYLASPMKTVPGTRMVVSLPDEDQRKAVIEYLGAASEE